MGEPSSPASTIRDALRSRAGGATALTAVDREDLTYDGLLSQLDEAVAALSALGIAPGDRIAMALRNGPDAATAFLAAASAGVAAPLNPDYQESEFEFYLNDLKPRVLLLAEGAASPAVEVASRLGVPIVRLSPRPSAGAFSLRSEGDADLGPANDRWAPEIALVLHTSGTTSRPKVVPLTHANLLASASSVAKTLSLGESDVCLNVMPMFHVHGLVAALLASLVSGARVVATPGFHPVHFFEWLARFRPTWYSAVPTMHQGVLARVDTNADVVRSSQLRFIRSASSALPPQVATGLEAAFRVPVIEAYGMTEGAHQIASNPLPPGTRKPGSVGIAAGPEVAIMGADGALLPAGARGEIVIRGVSVTSGYLANPEANASSWTNGWFRTGDEGVIDADGFVTITGRLKEIVNRGGEKIAPREIEETVLDHPAVAEAVAFAVPDHVLGEELGLAVVPKNGKSVGDDELRNHVAGRLSHFKVPRYVVVLEKLPKGATGKVQRIGLAAKLGLPGNASAPAVDETPPRTDIERELQAMWRAVLGVNVPGVRNGFLDYGGDSLLAVELVARVRDGLGVEIPVTDVLDNATIELLAERVTARIAEGGNRRGMGPVMSREPRAPLSPNQEWWLAIEARGKPSSASNRPSCVRLRGALDVEALGRAFDALVRRQGALRTFLPRAGDSREQAIVGDEHVEIPYVDLASAASKTEAVDAIVRPDILTPFDLDVWPLFRVKLLRLDENDHVLALVVHHTLIDGWSMATLVSDLAALYHAERVREPAALRPLAFDYAGHSVWLRDNVSRRRDELAAFWRSTLADVEMPPRFPVARPRTSEHHGLAYESRCHVIPATAYQRVVAHARGAKATPFMACLAAFHAAIAADHPGDVVTGSFVAGREMTGAEDLVGLFIHLLPLRTSFAGDPSARELIARVRTSMVSAFAHQHLPLHAMAALPGVRDSLTMVPLAPFTFQMRNMPSVGATGGGVEFSDYSIRSRQSRWEITVDLVERTDGLACHLDYATKLWDAATMDALLSRFETMLVSMAERPDSRMSDLAARAPRG